MTHTGRAGRVGELIEDLELAGAQLWEDDGALRFRAPPGVMTTERRQALAEARAEALAILRARDEVVRLEPAPGQLGEAFPLTEVQEAYLLGRHPAFRFGGVACHGYAEIPFADLDPRRLQAAWRVLIDRHDMLRAVIHADGTQRILTEVAPYQVACHDLRGADASRVTAELGRVRDRLSHAMHPADQWPLFTVEVSRADGQDTLHFSIDFLVADFLSTQLLLHELMLVYEDPDTELPPISVSFRDYALAERSLGDDPRVERARRYWEQRMTELRPAPELPPGSDDPRPLFRRWQLRLEPDDWHRLRERAGRHGVTASCAVLAGYAEVIGSWSRQPAFTLDLTLQNRLPLHEHVNHLVGDFTGVELLGVDTTADRPFAERARAIQQQLWTDLDHRAYSGLKVMRELSRGAGPGGAGFPVVFTSSIGVMNPDEAPDRGLSEVTYGITQTPQVTVDCQALEGRSGLVVNWDVRVDAFPDGLIDAMFGAFEALLRAMASESADTDVWGAWAPVGLPADQLRRRQAYNTTAVPVPPGLLHDGVLAAAQRQPDAVALVSGTTTLTYGELYTRATDVAARLVAAGARPGELVGVLARKGWAQAVGVLGVLIAGGAYLPIDTEQPAARRDRLLADAGVRHVLVESPTDGADLPVPAVPVDVPPTLDAVAPSYRAAPEDLAYVIYTSGSTGRPKGVMISHRGAVNTVVDINTRLEVGPGDRCLALSSLGFDLSVYDLFGILAAGGTLVYPRPDRPADPSHWAALVAEQRITVWNTVPAQLGMLVDYAEATPGVDLSSVRVAMLSGDWIPTQLPDRFRRLNPGARVVSLGGATEASIWSIWYPIDAVDPRWPSIPYGWPLPNQTFHVLDDALRPRPELVAGELYIGGVGVAEGYLGDPELTAAKFLTHPRTGERLYRTGDFGRFSRHGWIEFLGREDRQVKIRGHRIELAEVEEALRAEGDVRTAVVMADGDTPAGRRLVAFVEPARKLSNVDDNWLAAARDAAASRAADLLRGVDDEAYTAYRDAIRDAAAASMRVALHAVGVTVQSHVDQLASSLNPRYDALVRRWTAALDPTAEPNGDLDRLWDEASARGDGVGEQAVTGFMRRCATQLPDLLAKGADPVALLFGDDGEQSTATSIYHEALPHRWCNEAIAGAVADLARGSSRRLRVLEVGAGTGATTRAVLRAVGPGRLDYLVTDVSRYFLTVAQESLGDIEGVSYDRLDLEQPRFTSAVTPNSFDVVIAGDVLHAVRDVGAATRHLRELLTADGLLLVAELAGDELPVMMSLELLFDHAVGYGDVRATTGRPFLTTDEWRQALSAAGDPTEVVAAPLPGSAMAVFLTHVKTDRVALSADLVRQRLARRLPGYMHPGLVLVIDAMPLTGNGKVDARTLRGRMLPPETDAAAPTEVRYATELVRRLAEVWARVLRVPTVPPSAGFLDLGGDSLVAARLATQVRTAVPEARAMHFDELLRAMLGGASVDDVATLIETARAADGSTADEPAAARLLEQLADAPAGPAVVLVPTLDGAVPGATHGGPVWRLHADDPQASIDDLAERWATALASTGLADARIIGVGDACVLALETARWLSDLGSAGELVLVPEGRLPEDCADERIRDYDVLPYAGDIRLVCPADAQRLIGYWQEVCLGGLTVAADEGQR